MIDKLMRVLGLGDNDIKPQSLTEANLTPEIAERIGMSPLPEIMYRAIHGGYEGKKLWLMTESSIKYFNNTAIVTVYGQPGGMYLMNAFNKYTETQGGVYLYGILLDE